ncbi:S8 family serine peptidase [Emticicia sp. BO119]|uniref:S8 family serine peptidase n=1 Tax=Emticicia sp. BO119 TaxID=2757768 RepID=UPI0015F0493A|nr:S8 family serine peptidase [Emticicia sp. BO119]MBA4850957.1 S8 family serine peptidase [Emticicia sp. BO119]
MSKYFLKACFILQAFFSPILFGFGQSSKNDWVWKQIGISSEFRLLNPKKELVIAIIDDAFDLNNSFLKNYFYKNPKEIPGNSIDDDKNGKTDDIIGWDFSDNDNNVNPPVQNIQRFSHGTKVAGILIQTLQKLCVQTSSFKIIPIKTSSEYKQSNYIIDGYAGINYALEQKADIIITCWSGGLFDVEKEDILKRTQSQGVILIGSAGNFYADKALMPSAFPWVIAVAATDKKKHKYSVSNYGSFVDISAPSDSIATTYPSDTEFNNYLSATSAATPIVGGVVAAFMAAYPDLQAQDVDRLLKNTAEPIEQYNSLYHGKLGAGLVNVLNLKNYLESQELPKRFSQTKGYLPLWQKGEKTLSFTITPTGKYPTYNLILSKTLFTKSNINVSLFQDKQRKDTILTATQLSQPYTFRADSFQINFATKSFKGKNTYLYYEAQPIDSSGLYCRDKIIISGEEGYIEDGSGAENYANRCSCQWLIEVPKGKKIRINFEEFDTEAKIDQVYFFAEDGTESTILAIFSGSDIPPVITSWYNKVLVWFVTNESDSSKGWKLHYKAVDDK